MFEWTLNESFYGLENKFVLSFVSLFFDPCFFKGKRVLAFVKSVRRLLKKQNVSFVSEEPHCALKTKKHLLKNTSCYHQNANDRFGINAILQQGNNLLPCRIFSLTVLAPGCDSGGTRV